ncbi:MAG: transcriptional regulator [Phycisphaerales bacterium]|nr:MAG: transcriptional regulator [Phycisphaerales bacterium]
MPPQPPSPRPAAEPDDAPRAPGAEALVRLFHHRWAPGALAQLARDGGGRLVTIAHRLDAPRDSVRSALDALVELGLAAPNPGYGHPLRPEFLPTHAGLAAGPHCDRLLQSIRRMDARDACLRKWSMPTVYALHRGADRFAHIAGALQGVTPRALTSTLRDLASVDFVRRVVEDASPPRTRYTPMRRARAVAPILEDIADIAA